ncbi:MAG: 1-deoxy-D-xylulose-5-phosphate reductoisomerase [Spirochaetaceae bacterium]|jgi:1-deoxy-D-xylulose-5-phosphate reductoisomerase|nr:1-deoxy-D-xylulose-5-phosphate reductoisomerase [Spirochaetaceae bacterium]
MKKRVALLGASGSIGKSALDVLREGRDFFEPVLFSAHTREESLLKLKEEFPQAHLALSGKENGPEGIGYFGNKGLLEAIARAGADIVLNGISGSPGLKASLAAIQSGADLALANKETIVMASSLVFAEAEKAGVRILPVDSEHSAIFALLEAHGKERAVELLLTASGGPFRARSAESLESIGPEEALAHPTWSMGPKITIDSATLANKGLEVIEAVGLFGVTPEHIKVVIHPQSVVHSMIRLSDGAVYAQLSKPDMRLPIHNALYWPECLPCPFARLEFEGLTLEFKKPDFEKFPMLPLAYEAVKQGGVYPAVYNAANEIAVEAFLSEHIGFTDIPKLTREALSRDWQTGDDSLQSILEADKMARNLTIRYITEHFSW